MTREFYINARFAQAICNVDYSDLASHERGAINRWLADNTLSFTPAVVTGKAPDGKCAIMDYQPDNLVKIMFKV